MDKKGLKYAASTAAVLLLLLSCFTVARPADAAGRSRPVSLAALAAAMTDTVRGDSALTSKATADSTMARSLRRQDSIRQRVQSISEPIPITGLPDLGPKIADTMAADSLSGDLLPIDNFLDKPISGKNTDSLVYDVKNKMVFIHKDGDVLYGNMTLKADFIQVHMDTKELFAHGVPDTTGVASRPEFIDGSANYKMDTIAYNISTGKAKIKGVVTQEGDGYLMGENVKKMSDNVIHIRNGQYTTCEDHDHPHFYLALTKGKVIPNEKVIVGPSYLVMEDVPLYFLAIPEGFFPMTTGRSSGFIIPSYGEERARGFFLRDGGYYFALSDYADLTVRGSIYTKGSWEAKASSTYLKRYKFRGNFNFEYSKTILGEKGLDDYQNYGSYKVAWSHSQDAKARPGSTFTANVNFQTTNYAKYGATNMNDYVNSQTQSSISYSKSWAGTPWSLSASMNLSQNRRDSTYSISFPNVRVNMTKINPLKRKNAVGKERWYEKISLSYSGDLQNSVKTKESEVFSEQMFRDMINGVKHSVPVSLSFNMLSHINTTINVPYNEYWFFQKVEKEWDPVQQKQVEHDAKYGFYRAYDFNTSITMSTKLFGMYEVTDKYPNFFLRRIRHTITPSVGLSWAPDFQDQKYGFWKPIQTDSLGTINYYSPYTGAFSTPRGGKQGNITYSLAQTIELKVKDDSDSTGMRKVKLIDNFSFSGSYNLLAKEFNLSKINVNLRFTLPFLKNTQINLSGVLDPYYVRNDNGRAVRENTFLVKHGKLARLESTGFSFGHTFQGGSKQAAPGSINDTGGHNPLYDGVDPYYFDPDNPLDPEVRRQLMVKQYYDFAVPWSLTFNYTMKYTNDGVTKKTSQQVTFNGSVTLTPKWAVSASGFGYDFDSNKFTPGSFVLTRDLHCWQMNFNWVPFGTRKSWSFNISVKSALLRDLKYDKSSSFYDNIYSEGSR